MAKQFTSSILMIQPVAFQFNEETAVNNYYQKVLKGVTHDQVQSMALLEFKDFVHLLESNGVEVIVVEDTTLPNTPDSIFPNNWISFHQDGRVALYPMCAKNRRLERRMDILDILRNKHNFIAQQSIDFTHYEHKNIFLEGTGSLLLDRENRIAYASLSLRTDLEVLQDFCKIFGYKPHSFVSKQTVGKERLPIYHTNVMMCLADTFAILCADSIDDSVERQNLIQSLELSGKEIIYITENQKHCFAGNMLQVCNKSQDRFLVMSNSAHQALTAIQIKQIETHCSILSSSLDTIEACGGGSARCMMAEIFLPKKNKN
jgi:hypothetical protein